MKMLTALGPSKIMLAQLVKDLPPFVKYETLLAFSRKLAIRQYPKPD